MTDSPAAQHWLDGIPLADGRIALSAESPLLQAGEGWFETLRIEGGRPLQLEAHLDRLLAAVVTAGLAASIRASLDHALAPALAAAAGYEHGRLRITLLPRAIFTDPPEVLVSLAPYAPPVLGYSRGLVVITTRLSHPRLGLLGKSLSYHWSQAARREAQARGADEALFAVDGGWLEASTASLLWPTSGGWRTTSGCAGTLDSVTLEALRRTGLAIDPCEWADRADILQGGLLLVSSLRLVVSVREIDGEGLPDLTRTAAKMRERLLAQAD